jgi:phosphoribosylanthranilate isomerase
MFVKVCQITNEEDALLAIAMGADALGFIFAPSPRQVQPPIVADIVKRLPTDVLTFGVFVNETPSRVIDMVQAAGLRGAQLHGGTPDQTRAVHEKVRVVFKAFAAGDPAVRKVKEHGADAVHIDNARPGSGRVFDWSLAEDVPAGQRLVLAGGLTPENVGDAIDIVKPWGVDVGSGVEASLGKKDPRKLRAFVANARAAFEVLESQQHVPDSPAPYDWREDG